MFDQIPEEHTNKNIKHYRKQHAKEEHRKIQKKINAKAEVCNNKKHKELERDQKNGCDKEPENEEYIIDRNKEISEICKAMCFVQNKHVG